MLPALGSSILATAVVTLAEGEGAILFALFVIAVPLGIAIAVVYNKLNPLRHSTSEAEAGIEVVMQKRLQLTSRLVSVAAQYAGHEKVIHLQISQDKVLATRHAMSPFRQTGRAVAYVAGLADQFPNLKADATYMRLMDDLSQLERDIERSYATYNGRVKEYNTTRSSFPIMMFADLLGFKAARYLEPSLWYPRHTAGGTTEVT